MNTLLEIEAAQAEMVQLLITELEQVEKKIEDVDIVRTNLLKDILNLRFQYDGIVKHLEMLGEDISNF